MTLPDPSFRIEPADYRADFDALRAIRETVFVAEQQVPIEEEWDELDPVCRHVLARDLSGHPIGTGRMSHDGKIGRIAVMPEWRDRGVGAALLRTLLEQAREQGLAEVRLSAQVSALDFYLKHGFAEVGGRFMEAGIEHQTMRRAIEAPEPVPRAPSDLPPSQPAHTIETLDQAIEVLVECIPLSRNLIRIYSRDLEPALLGHPDVLEALRRFASQHRDARVLIVVQDPVEAQARRNGLFDLAQRLTSRFQFRAPTEAQDLHYPSSYVATDRGGFVYRTLGSHFDGEASTCLPARARQLIQHFDATWERSRPCTEFRALGI